MYEQTPFTKLNTPTNMGAKKGPKNKCPHINPLYKKEAPSSLKGLHYTSSNFQPLENKICCQKIRTVILHNFVQ